MTKQEARNILIHFDDHVWQRDNGVTPEATAEAIDIAVAALGESGSPAELMETASPAEPEERRIIGQTRGVRLDMSGLSTRAINWLGAYGIRTMEDLLRCSKKFIGRLQNIGKQTVAEIEEAVRTKGHELGTLPAIYVLGHSDYAVAVYKPDGSEKHKFSTKNEAIEFIREENKKIRG